MKKRFTKVKGVSERRRLPRMGIIRLGLKVKSGAKEYPTETDYFVVTDAPGVEKALGSKPKEIEVVFPVNDPEVVFPQSYVMYGRSSGKKCEGDGEVARAYDDTTKTWVDRTCPCEQLGKNCNLSGTLMFFIPSVSWGGIYQIRTSSINSIQDVNSALEMYQGMLGRISMVPFTLLRKPISITKDGKSRTHYTLQLEYRGATKDIIKIQASNPAYLQMNNQFLLEAPDDTDPKLHPVDKEEPPEDYYEGEVETASTESKDEKVPEKAIPEEPMTKEQISELRKKMSSAGLTVLEDQNVFFLWQMERVKGKKTFDFAETFLTNFLEIYNAYLIKDAPNGDVPGFLGGQ